MGPYQGGQAEFIRVPFADFNALKLPPGKEHEADFALLADIFPTVRVISSSAAHRRSSHRL